MTVQENTSFWQKFGLSLLILALLIFIALATAVLSAFLNQDSGKTWLSGFAQNFSTEMMGAIITFGSFELVLNRQQREQEKNSAEARQKRRLQILAGSRINLIALQALDELRAEDWMEEVLQDEATKLGHANWQNAYLPEVALPEKNMEYINLQGTDLIRAQLKGANLSNAQLEGANLRFAQLKGADLQSTQLQGANLQSTQLQGANLRFAQLEGADLQSTQLQGANLQSIQLKEINLCWARLQGANLRDVQLQDTNLSNAQLEGANLHEAQLQGANLEGANLAHANMYRVECDENTKLPDGTTWTVNTDWSQFGAVECDVNKDNVSYKWYKHLYQHDLLRQHLIRLNETEYENEVQKLRDKGLIN